MVSHSACSASSNWWASPTSVKTIDSPLGRRTRNVYTSMDTHDASMRMKDNTDKGNVSPHLVGTVQAMVRNGADEADYERGRVTSTGSTVSHWGSERCGHGGSPVATNTLTNVSTLNPLGRFRAVVETVRWARRRSGISLRQILSDGDTGIDRIAAIDPSDRFRRLLWLAMYIFLQVLTVYYIVLVVQQRFKFETATSITLRDDAEMRMPSVTFCNLNPVKKAALCSERHFTWNSSYDQQKRLCTERLGIAEYTSLLNKLIGREDNMTFEDLGHALSDMLVGCSVQGRLCGLSEFREVSELQGKYGRCYSVFSQGDAAMVFNRTETPTEGFNMILRTESHEYIPSSEAEGFVVLLHSPEVQPDDSMDGIFVAPQRTTYISVEPRLASRLGEPYPSRCTGRWRQENLPSWLSPSHVTDSYSTKLCMQICFSDTINHKCANCRDLPGGPNRQGSANDPKIILKLAKDATSFCHGNMSCALNLLGHDHQFQCNCPQRCQESMLTTKIVEFPAMPDINALCLAGGFINMYSGMTFLTVWELLEIAYYGYGIVKRKLSEKFGAHKPTTS